MIAPFRHIYHKDETKPRLNSNLRRLVATIGCIFIAYLPGNAFAASDLFGVIEIGTSGVKMSHLNLTREQAVTVQQQFEEDRANFKYELVEKDLSRSEKSKNTNVRLPENLDITIKAITEVRETLTEKYSVPAENIFVFASSGVSALKHADQIRDRLSDLFKPDQIAFLNAFQECELTYYWIVPRSRYKEAIVFDIGSGNVKACYLEDPWSSEPQMQSFELLDVGTKTFSDRIESAFRADTTGQTSFLKEADRLRRVVVERALAAKASTFPALMRPRRAYFVGGIVWAITTLVRPEKINEDWITIGPDDWRTMRNRVRVGRTFDLDLTRFVNQPQRRESAEKAVYEIRANVFNENQIAAGTEILIAMHNVLRFVEQRTERRGVFFSSRGYEGMRFQFLLNKISGS